MHRVLLAVLGDPATVEILLNADGTVWQERLGEPLRPIGTMPARRAEAVLRTLQPVFKRQSRATNRRAESRSGCAISPVQRRHDRDAGGVCPCSQAGVW
jgi:hypothetical protein